MDTVSPFPIRPDDDASGDVEQQRISRRVQTLTVTATYRLSEQGRKASLLAGGDGRALQEITVAVPTSRMHLAHVDDEGRARLKLQPRYFLNGEQQVVSNQDPPMFDVIPSIDDLLKEAGRNHQLERAYAMERAETKRKRLDGRFDSHQEIAGEFLADPARRAHEHPRPTPRQCYLTARNRIVFYDARTDHGQARQVPPEAYRRYCADVKERSERNREMFRCEMAVHEQRERAIADWVQTSGTPDQQERHAAGMLPLREVLEAMGDETFAAAMDRPRYVYDGVDRLRAHLQQCPDYADAIVTKRDLRVTTAHADDATDAQWALIQELKSFFPDAEVVLQRHRLTWTHNAKAPSLTVWGVLVKRKVGPFLLLREYLAPTPVEDEQPKTAADREIYGRV